METTITLSQDGYFIHVLQATDGKNRRYTIAPLIIKCGVIDPTDISNDPPGVKTACLEAWTDEVIEAYQAHLEESAI